MSSGLVRKSVVSGRFYPSIKDKLEKYLEEVIDPGDAPVKAKAVIMPHAGYMYSGKIAAKTIGRVKIPDNVILIGPNHTGHGTPVSIMDHGTWEMPLGNVPVNHDIASFLVSASRFIEPDSQAHLAEHSLEVQLPFLYYLNPNVSIVPITVGTQSREALESVGAAIAAASKKYDFLIVVSSDMTHYENHEVASKKDHEALSLLCDFKRDEFADFVEDQDVSMCGFVAAYIMLTAVQEMGATEAQLVDYCTSGDVTDNKESVVGYAGVVIK